MTIDEARKMLADVRPHFYDYPEPVKVYLHWTAGDYDTTYDDYHFCITGDGVIHNTHDLWSDSAATWKRNEGSISIALCCAKDAQAFKGFPNYAVLGNYPPTAKQIESCAHLMAIISDVFDIPIDIFHFLTHGEAGDNMDGEWYHPCYGQDTTCERWDLAVLNDHDEWGSGGDTLRGKAIWYQNHV